MRAVVRRPKVKSRPKINFAAPNLQAPRPGYVDAVCAELTAQGNQRDATALATATRRRSLASGVHIHIHMHMHMHMHTCTC